MLRSLFILLLAFLFVSCTSQTPPVINTSEQPSIAEIAAVPRFQHIVLILFENEDFGNVIGNQEMPHFNQLAMENTLLIEYEAIRHPSLPNYIALIGGDTFGIDQDCNDCFIDATSLPDLIEASGRSWKTYQEDMPGPCYLGDAELYAQKHNPFVYFDPIRLDKERCERSVVPLTELETDIQSGTLPNFIFISPNLCNDAHDCSLDVADQWLGNRIAQLVPALDSTGYPYLIALVFDEGKRDRSILRFFKKTGGRIPTVFISPQGKNAFQDNTPYTHYSLLKTIAESWGLAYLGHAADENTVLITAPWR
jgi:phosphatidylinositol-3-phosphatase